MEDLNLHFTGDFHAITSANNLLAAVMDNHMHQGNALRIDPKRIVFKRCLDMNDRVLRNIIVGMGKKGDGVMRQDGFVSQLLQRSWQSSVWQQISRICRSVFQELSLLIM